MLLHWNVYFSLYFPECVCKFMNLIKRWGIFLSYTWKIQKIKKKTIRIFYRFLIIGYQYHKAKEKALINTSNTKFKIDFSCKVLLLMNCITNFVLPILVNLFKATDCLNILCSIVSNFEDTLIILVIHSSVCWFDGKLRLVLIFQFLYPISSIFLHYYLASG